MILSAFGQSLLYSQQRPDVGVGGGCFNDTTARIFGLRTRVVSEVMGLRQPRTQFPLDSLQIISGKLSVVNSGDLYLAGGVKRCLYFNKIYL